MPGVRKLLVAVVGQTDMVEEYCSPKAAATLSRKVGRDHLFAEFAAAVAKEATEAEAQEPEPDFEALQIAVIGAEHSITHTPRSAAELAERLQKERLFLEFADKVAHQAKRLRKIIGEREQLQFVWQQSQPTPPHDASGRKRTLPLFVEGTDLPPESEALRENDHAA